MRILAVLIGVLVMTSPSLARQQSVLHCFYFTPIEEATNEEWDAFYEATDTLQSKLKGLKRVWVGKRTDRAPVSQQVKLGRTYGVCMEFTDEAALKSYAPDRSHDEWIASYEKVRRPGTPTFDIVGQ